MKRAITAISPIMTQGFRTGPVVGRKRNSDR